MALSKSEMGLGHGSIEMLRYAQQDMTFLSSYFG